MPRLRLALAQTNPIVGDFDGNISQILSAARSAWDAGADILMVGEIRDSETANTALQAAMTGHLVLTTLHSNNAPAALARARAGSSKAAKIIFSIYPPK